MSKDLGRKVEFRAFGGKLTSKPIDWPEQSIGRDIVLMLDMEQPHINIDKDGFKEFATVTKRGRFEHTGGFGMTPDRPAIYVLVEVS